MSASITNLCCNSSERTCMPVAIAIDVITSIALLSIGFLLAVHILPSVGSATNALAIGLAATGLAIICFDVLVFAVKACKEKPELSIGEELSPHLESPPLSVRIDPTLSISEESSEKSVGELHESIGSETSDKANGAGGIEESYLQKAREILGQRIDVGGEDPTSLQKIYVLGLALERGAISPTFVDRFLNDESSELIRELKVQAETLASEKPGVFSFLMERTYITPGQAVRIEDNPILQARDRRLRKRVPFSEQLGKCLKRELM